MSRVTEQSGVLYEIVTLLKLRLRWLYLHDRMKEITEQIVENYNRNNLVKFEKDSLFYF